MLGSSAIAILIPAIDRTDFSLARLCPDVFLLSDLKGL